MYADRINTHREMVRLDKILADGHPSEGDIIAFVEAAIRNEMCFAELRSFNDTGKFLGRHPLVADNDELDELRRKLLQDPESFLADSRNVDMNIVRYRSYLNSSRYSEEDKAKYREMLETHLHRQELYRQCLKNAIYEKRL